MLPYSATKRMTVFKRARGWPAPVGREEVDVRRQQVSSIHVFRGRRSSKSKISWSGEVVLWVGTTRSMVVCFAAAVLTLAAAFFLDFPAAGLVAAVDFGLGFLGLAVLVVAVTSGSSGASVTG